MYSLVVYFIFLYMCKGHRFFAFLFQAFDILSLLYCSNVLWITPLTIITACYNMSV